MNYHVYVGSRRKVFNAEYFLGDIGSVTEYVSVVCSGVGGANHDRALEDPSSPTFCTPSGVEIGNRVGWRRD